MLAARLHGPSDLRVEQIERPSPPQPGQVLIRIRTTGVCGSDLHSYTDARIGDTVVETPLILGHEFAGIVETVGAGATDGFFQPLAPGTRVAVDPAQPCGHCEWCARGDPNLCCRLQFCGNHPYGGSLCQWILMPDACCFPVPDEVDDTAAALLEPLSVALHAIDLARLRIGLSAVILGAGPIGLLLLHLARRAGADPVFVTDQFPWRLEVAREWGGIPIRCDAADPVGAVLRETQQRGVDVAIEAAWGEDSVAQAVEMVALGGKIVLVGISSDDRLQMKASTARRKGLTLRLSRRMQHAYPRALRLVRTESVPLSRLVSHRFPLAQAADAFALNAAYRDQVLKLMIDS